MRMMRMRFVQREGTKKIVRSLSSHLQPLIQRWWLNLAVKGDIAFGLRRRTSGRYDVEAALHNQTDKIISSYSPMPTWKLSIFCTVTFIEMPMKKISTLPCSVSLGRIL